MTPENRCEGEVWLGGLELQPRPANKKLLFLYLVILWGSAWRWINPSVFS